MYQDWILTALLVWPVVAAGIVLVAPERLAKHLALTATVIEFALSLPLWLLLVPEGGFQFLQQAAWGPPWGTSSSSVASRTPLFPLLLTPFLPPLAVLSTSYS